MPTVLCSSYRNDGRIADFARALAEQGWTIAADPATRGFLASQGINTMSFATSRVEDGTILNEYVQGFLACEDTHENRIRLGSKFVDLLVVDFAPLKDVLQRDDVGDRRPVFAGNGRAMMVISALVGLRPIVTDLNDLPRVLDWITQNQQSGWKLRWLQARAAETLTIRMDALTRILSGGTCPGGMLIGSGPPDPDSEEWQTACRRPLEVLVR